LSNYEDHHIHLPKSMFKTGDVVRLKSDFNVNTLMTVNWVNRAYNKDEIIFVHATYINRDGLQHDYKFDERMLAPVKG